MAANLDNLEFFKEFYQGFDDHSLLSIRVEIMTISFAIVRERILLLSIWNNLRIEVHVDSLDRLSLYGPVSYLESNGCGLVSKLAGQF